MGAPFGSEQELVFKVAKDFPAKVVDPDRFEAELAAAGVEPASLHYADDSVVIRFGGRVPRWKKARVCRIVGLHGLGGA